MSDQDFVALTLSYTQYKAGCAGNYLSIIHVFFCHAFYCHAWANFNFCYTLFLEQDSIPIPFSTFVENYKDFVSPKPSTSALLSTSSTVVETAPETANPTNLQKFQAQQVESSLTVLNSLPAQSVNAGKILVSRVGQIEHSVRIARMASPRRKKFSSHLPFSEQISFFIIIFFFSCCPCSVIYSSFFLVGWTQLVWIKGDRHGKNRHF